MRVRRPLSDFNLRPLEHLADKVTHCGRRESEELHRTFPGRGPGGHPTITHVPLARARVHGLTFLHGAGEGSSPGTPVSPTWPWRTGREALEAFGNGAREGSGLETWIWK